MFRIFMCRESESGGDVFYCFPENALKTFRNKSAHLMNLHLELSHNIMEVRFYLLFFQPTTHIR